MDEFTHEQVPLLRESVAACPVAAALPLVSEAERDFWRRAVAVERARQRCPRPAPFPFQEKRHR